MIDRALPGLYISIIVSCCSCFTTGWVCFTALAFSWVAPSFMSRCCAQLPPWATPIVLPLGLVFLYCVSCPVLVNLSLTCFPWLVARPLLDLGSSCLLDYRIARSLIGCGFACLSLASEGCLFSEWSCCCRLHSWCALLVAARLWCYPLILLSHCSVVGPVRLTLFALCLSRLWLSAWLWLVVIFEFVQSVWLLYALAPLASS